MVGLISENDSKVLGGTGFIKNAVLYKDLFAFYDAYVNLLSLDSNDIPNYCKLTKGRLCLEGICLFMKNYASELGFETLNLTLGYLKVLYYTIASYSNGKTFPDRKAIEVEFRAYKDASTKVFVQAKEKVKVAEQSYNLSKEDFEKHNNSCAGKKVTARVLDGAFIVFLVLAFMSAMVAFSFYFISKIPLQSAIISATALLVVCLSVAITLKIISKKLEARAGEMTYELQNKKRTKDLEAKKFASEKDNLNRIISERYEFKNNFSWALTDYYSPLSFEEIAKLAKEYRLLSYNIKLDVLALFKNQSSEATSIINQLKHLSKSDKMKDLEEIYEQIDAKDWLKYNSEVRVEFLKRFIQQASKTFEWKLDFNGTKIDPFGINAKLLAKEQIVYLKSQDDLFVTSSLDKFLNTNLVKNEKILFLEGSATCESLRELKAQYISHFYNYNETKKYDNLFYENKMTGAAKVSEDIIDNYSKIPTFVWLKIKSAENQLNMANPKSSTIRQLEEIIAENEGGELSFFEDLENGEDSKEKVNLVAEIYAEDVEGFGIKYTFGENTFIGYRLA